MKRSLAVRMLLPFIIVVAFWGIFLWGMNNPEVGNGVITFTIVVITLFIICFGKKLLWSIISNSGRTQQQK